MQTDARKQALAVLNAFSQGRTTLDHVMGRILDPKRILSSRDRAFAQTLIYGVLRWQNRLDWILSRFSKVPLDRMEPAILNLLRLGLFQILYLSRVPESAAVNTSVQMAKSISASWVVRFVNAVLRKAAREHQQIAWPDFDRNPEKALAVTRSLPRWLAGRWLARYGIREAAALCDAINEIPPITVRANSLKTNRGDLMASLQREARDVTLTRYAPDGVRFFSPIHPIPQIHGFQDGWFQVQDEAAQLVGCLVDPQPGECILDACAGRGGKTGHLAQLMKNNGQIIALDEDEMKLKSLQEEMKRLGVSLVATCRHDLNHPLDAGADRRFDRILLDAPCSGLGVLRRNPDARWMASKKNLFGYQKKQLGFLKNLAPVLKVGGVLIYAVCSFEPEENEQVVDTFLSTHPQFAVDTDVNRHTGPFAVVFDQAGFMRTFPHQHRMDGFFAVRLKRLS